MPHPSAIIWPTMLQLTCIILAINRNVVKGLANCPYGCDCDDDTLVVKCGEGSLDVLPIALNPSIQRLVIKNNKIKTIDSSIQFYAELTFLDLSNNHLLSIPQRTFAYQKKLQELSLNHNKIGSINNKTFIGLSSLTVLNLRGNILDELEGDTFAAIGKLEELNLGQNRIKRIDPKAFDGLVNLKVLYLDDNTLTTVPTRENFNAMSCLAELFLGINSYVTIPDGAFEDLKGLSRLDLRGAGLHNISKESLKGLDDLKVLDISDNHLSRIPTSEFSGLTRLEELFLGQNAFEILPEGAFAGLKNLRRLDITGAASLQRILSGAFAANTNLESLTLSNNKILEEIQEGALSGLPHLKHVVLRDNGLTTMTEGLFPWAELETLDLSENPIVCDCRILWLRNLIVSKNATNDMDQNVVCDQPSRLHGEHLRSLNVDLLGCSHSNPRMQAMIGALLVGSAATLTALALIIYRCRRRIREVLKGGCGSSALRGKEREYQKTFSDEDYVTHGHPHPCGFGVAQTIPTYSADTTNGLNHHPSLRPIPVTEL